MKFTALSFLYVVLIAEANLRAEEKRNDRALQTCQVSTVITGTCDYSTVKASVLAAGCTEASFFSLLGVGDEAGATAAVNLMCASADEESYENFVPWNAITDRGFQFDKEFFNGGTILNEEYATADAPDLLATQTTRIAQIESTIVQSRGVEFPSYISQFADQKCDDSVVMCCWTADRDSVGAGTCTGTGCQDEDPVDNTDVCYHDSRDSSFAAHVIDATNVFTGDSEGAVHCHGFTYQTELEQKYKGNSLFEVAFSRGLLGNGYVREVPGAPMCGCIDTMPKVTSAGCSSTAATEQWAIATTIIDGAETLDISLSGVSIDFSDCSAGTLGAEVQSKTGAALSTNFFSDCATAEAAYTESKGFRKSAAEWVPVAGMGSLYADYADNFRDIWAQSPNQILRRICAHCQSTHQDIYYRRFDTTGLPADFDLLYVVTDYWHSSPNIEHNDFNTDFKLYSTYDDAIADTNAWTFCNFNDGNVGFPRDCGPTGFVGGQWNAISRNPAQWHVRFYVESG